MILIFNIVLLLMARITDNIDIYYTVNTHHKRDGKMTGKEVGTTKAYPSDLVSHAWIYLMCRKVGIHN